MNKSLRIFMLSLACGSLLVLVFSHIYAHEGDGDHDSMCQEPHVGTPTEGWWCDTPEKWLNAYWAHENSPDETNDPEQSDYSPPAQAGSYLPRTTGSAHLYIAADYRGDSFNESTEVERLSSTNTFTYEDAEEFIQSCLRWALLFCTQDDLTISVDEASCGCN